MDNIITIDVRSREVLAVEQQRPIVAGNVGVDFVDIALDEEWDGLTKRVTFSNAGNDVTVPFATPLEIPHECISHGYLSISVVGVDADGEEVLRTKAMRKPLVVNASGADMGGEAAPRTMDVAALAEKRMDEIEAAIPAAQAAADNANTAAADLLARAAAGEFDGPQGPQGPKGADGTMTFEDLTPEQREQLRGPQGVQGPRGERGEAGPAGAQGPQGVKGDTGATGPQGPAGSDATATDVRINGMSITDGGVADIPIASADNLGLIKMTDSYGSYGFNVNRSNGVMYIVQATNGNIDTRGSLFRPISSSNLDYAVKAAMCDGKGTAWTDSEKLAARERLGIGRYELIEEIIATEAFTTLIRSKTPSGKDYHFSKLMIWTEVGGIAPQNQISCLAYVNGVEIADGFMLASSTTQSKGAVTFDVSDGIISTEYWCTSFNNTATTPLYRGICRNARALVESINSIQITTKSQATPITEGTNIKIYGVWA